MDMADIHSTASDGSYNLLLSSIKEMAYIQTYKIFLLTKIYEPLEVSKCEKCGKVIAEPKELIKIVK